MLASHCCIAGYPRLAAYLRPGLSRLQTAPTTRKLPIWLCKVYFTIKLAASGVQRSTFGGTPLTPQFNKRCSALYWLRSFFFVNWPVGHRSIHRTYICRRCIENNFGCDCRIRCLGVCQIQDRPKIKSETPDRQLSCWPPKPAGRPCGF